MKKVQLIVAILCLAIYGMPLAARARGGGGYRGGRHSFARRGGWDRESHYGARARRGYVGRRWRGGPFWGGGYGGWPYFSSYGWPYYYDYGIYGSPGFGFNVYL